MRATAGSAAEMRLKKVALAAKLKSKLKVRDATIWKSAGETSAGGTRCPEKVEICADDVSLCPTCDL